MATADEKDLDCGFMAYLTIIVIRDNAIGVWLPCVNKTTRRDRHQDIHLLQICQVKVSQFVTNIVSIAFLSVNQTAATNPGSCSHHLHHMYIPAIYISIDCPPVNIYYLCGVYHP